jgi:small ligand-binding sensory domain FIST
MEFISRIADTSDKDRIVDQLLMDGVSGQFDLGVLFVTPSVMYDPQEIYKEIEKRVGIRNFLCCTCAGIIGNHREIEGTPSASIMLARLPDVSIKPFYLDQAQLDQLTTSEQLYEFFEVYPNEKPNFLILPDPFRIDSNQFLQSINQSYPKSSVFGGLASAATQEKENLIIINNEVYDEGLAGIVLTGNIAVEMVVSQGCRPIGKTFIVTKAEGNIIYELAGRSFYEVIKEVLEQASPRDRSLAQEAIFVGIAMNEYNHKFKRGDFLIRGVMAIDPDTGGGAVADYVQVGQTVQFHLRDAQTAQEDLHELLNHHRSQFDREQLKGAFIFSCNGRGENLFRIKDHDIKIIQQSLGPMPAAGFFCAGEIGPVGGVNFLHGFTSSMALIYAPK